MKRCRWLLIGLVACIIVFIVIFCCRDSEDSPADWITWNTTELSGDAKQGEPETILLENKRVRVLHNDVQVWQTEEDIPVQDILWCDIDHDEQKELMLLCWKRGRYGESRPFWVTEDEKDWSQHIYIYDWTEGAIKPIWMASDIGMEVETWYFDETQRLVITDRNDKTTAWDWVSWGLSSIDLQEVSTLTFGAVGDNLIHRQIYEYALRHFEGNFDDLFVCVQQELDRYDVTSINQETIYVNQRSQYSCYPMFGTPIEVGDAVIKAGFDIVSCATNHALDKGVEAIDLTASVYEQAGVVYAGIQPVSDGSYEPYELFEKNEISCAIFSYTQMTNGHALPEETSYVLHTLDDEQQVREDLQAGREAADLCIVYVHWGTEYADEPDEEQLRWASIFADCGVDVVIGTHPHVLQSVEWVAGQNGHDMLVYYSLGNFISAQEDESCRIGGLAYFTVVKENGICHVTDYGLKKLITEEDNGHYTTRLLEQ